MCTLWLVTVGHELLGPHLPAHSALTGARTVPIGLVRLPPTSWAVWEGGVESLCAQDYPLLSLHVWAGASPQTCSAVSEHTPHCPGVLNHHAGQRKLQCLCSGLGGWHSLLNLSVKLPAPTASLELCRGLLTSASPLTPPREWGLRGSQQSWLCCPDSISTPPWGPAAVFPLSSTLMLLISPVQLWFWFFVSEIWWYKWDTVCVIFLDLVSEISWWCLSEAFFYVFIFVNAGLKLGESFQFRSSWRSVLRNFLVKCLFSLFRPPVIRRLGLLVDWSVPFPVSWSFNSISIFISPILTFIVNSTFFCSECFFCVCVPYSFSKFHISYCGKEIVILLKFSFCFPPFHCCLWVPCLGCLSWSLSHARDFPQIPADCWLSVHI